MRRVVYKVKDNNGIIFNITSYPKIQQNGYKILETRLETVSQKPTKTYYHKYFPSYEG